MRKRGFLAAVEGEEGVNVKERKQRETLAVEIDVFCQQLFPGKEESG